VGRRANLFVPCLAEVFDPAIGVAAARCLAASGFDVVRTDAAACCGQVSLNSGRPRDAARLARRFVRAHADADLVVMPSGSCARMVRERYGELLAGRDLEAWEGLRHRVLELCELLSGPSGPGAWGGRLAARAVLHWSCHMPGDEATRSAVEGLLRGIDGLDLLPRPADECCGFGGVFWTAWRDVSAAIGTRRMRELDLDRPDLVLFAEPGCLAQARVSARDAGASGRVLHVAEALAEAIGFPARPQSIVAPAAPARPSAHGPGPGLVGRASAAAGDARLGAAVLKATDQAQRSRAAAIAGIDWESARAAATEARRRAVSDRDALLERLVARLESRGVRVHRAADGREAVAQALAVASGASARSVVKSKSMVGEEIGLARCLEAAGLHVVETDLGEYVVQLRGEPPSHITAPALHVSRGDVARLFADKLGLTGGDAPAALAAFARERLRSEFLAADLGIIGVNLAVADTGDLVTVTNEGNGRLCSTLPRTLVAVTSIDKVVATPGDAAAVLRVLARSATGQAASAYVSLLRAPASPGDPFGPADVHLVLVDNGRSRMAADPLYSDMLRCVRCGACLNACPVYRTIGGHAYGRTYPGPLGIVMGCALDGVEAAGELTYACTLCGECGRVCPVGIDLPEAILRLRSLAPKPAARRLSLGLAASTLASPRRLRLAGKAMAGAARSLPSLYGRAALAAGWTGPLPPPAPAPRPFSALWPGLEASLADVPRVGTGRGISRVDPSVPVREPLPAPVLLDRFLDRFRAASGEIAAESSPGAAVVAIAVAAGARTVLVDRGAEASGVADALREAGIEAVLSCGPGIDRATAAAAGVGVSTCAALVAETGSILLLHGAPEDRVASLLPPVHVVLARRDLVIESLEQALAARDASQAPASTLVTGPSRTADIEKVLILGMHGPRRVVLVLVDA
jgi:L-lactate dehydrogenase complex protein LldF